MKRTKSYLIISLFLVTTSLYAQRIKGSDTGLPVSQQAAENFMKKYPKAHVTVTGGKHLIFWQINRTKTSY